MRKRLVFLYSHTQYSNLLLQQDTTIPQSHTLAALRCHPDKLENAQSTRKKCPYTVSQEQTKHTISAMKSKEIVSVMDLAHNSSFEITGWLQILKTSMDVHEHQAYYLI